nr:replication-associated protein [Cressdnaviricota sp.]
MSRSRNWCFTSWEPLDWAKIVEDRAEYLIVGEEVCPSTGKAHYQGYVEFPNPIGLGGLKKLFDKATHFEPRRGTQKQAREYCMKDGKYQEFGEFTEHKPGKRTDLEKVVDMIAEGKPDYEIVPELTSIQSVRVLESVRQKLIVPRDANTKPTVFWFWGDTGTGKSRTVKEETNGDYDDCDYVNGFLIGYTGNKTVVFDDYRGSIPLHTLLKMLDYGKCTVNVKGGSCFFAATTVYITANGPPRDVYRNAKHENIMQLERRITEIREFPGMCTEVKCTEVGGNTRPPTPV